MILLFLLYSCFQASGTEGKKKREKLLRRGPKYYTKNTFRFFWNFEACM